MRKPLAALFLILVVVLIADGVISYGRGSYEQQDWHKSMEAFETARVSAKARGNRILLYIYTDWCGYCRRFEAQFLDNEVYSDFLSDFERVRLNPDEDPRVRKLMEEYGVTGFPSVLVGPNDEDNFLNVRPFRRRNGVWILKTGSELMSELSFGSKTSYNKAKQAGTR